MEINTATMSTYRKEQKTDMLNSKRPIDINIEEMKRT